ncbi:glycine cleavage system aminomethyltransferase GcvT [Microbacterium sp. USHLN186]|uniref:glycine cleavage system aminomethyltransferase GcvT n=1 Tax=Microbacterium sp. USHLN186 TaxID=3081286 RepID=UPI003016797F
MTELLEPQGDSPRYTPLRERHEALGASFTDFGGWQMPVRYTSDLAEHRAVREAAGVFDISHMAEFTVRGTAAAAYLDHALAGRLSAMSTGKAKYSLLLAEDGGIIDDVIVYRLADDDFLIISNAGNRDAVREALLDRVSAVSGDVEVLDVSDDYGLIAVQGPNAARIVAAVDGIDDISVPWDEQKYYSWARATYNGKPLLLARTGYTGEDGFELLVDAADAPALWDAVLSAGTDHGLVPAGLAARDTLRLEAGMPLYGHELTRRTVPAQAGLGRVVAADKDGFIGKDALASGAAGTGAHAGRTLIGLSAEGRRAGRAGYPVVLEDGTVVGEITSGALSPTLGHPIAMAFVDASAADGQTPLFLDVRGTRTPATPTALPFYRRKK